MTIGVFLDEHGFLRGIPYHDGLLEAVVLSEGQISLGVRSTDGVPHVIELRGVSAFSAEGMREGNVILNVRLMSAAQIASDLELTRLVRERLQIDGATSGTVFYMESSFGADVLAVCTDWAVTGGAIKVCPE